ncbi:unnamed protein product [Caenorhabditis bovis]|uniref:Arrestin C-terminal-like domain-containing protein n=1 Tax=Caenorhabditis bovis TaxID=2654633 RepID=A0A8S1ENR9_9PELO|nr:unnamed protein product [Caenorhabditis bovis]
MPFTLSLAITNGDEIFAPGGAVEGFATFDLRETIKAKQIRVIAEGCANTKWLLSEGSKASHGRSREVSYTAKTTYMDEELVVWKPSEGHAKSSIFPGCHVFPFKFVIPENAPPSFKGDHGIIRYSIKAIVERPWKTNRSTTKYFTVCPKKDLNNIATARDEASSSKLKKMTIPKKGYVAGETISVETKIANDSSRPIIKAECYLVERCKYLAYRYGIGDPNSTHYKEDLPDDSYSSRKHDEHRLATISQDLEIPARSQHSLNLQLPIPCVCPSFASTLITVEYVVIVKLVVKCRLVNTVKTECPIILGTIPLKDEAIDPGTPHFGEAPSVVQLTHRSMTSCDDEKALPKYIFYPRYNKPKIDDEPPILIDTLPPIDTLSMEDECQ